MLRELHIENIAIIDNLVLRFLPGLNIITGETGAGKSIIINAMGLLLGFRASNEAVRSGCEKGFVSGVFEIGEEFKEAFEVYGIPDLEEGIIILSREISRGGKNFCRVNEKIFPLSAFRLVGSKLIDIYGQNEERGLLLRENQLSILDKLGGRELLELKEEAAGLFRQLNELEQLIQEEKRKQQEVLERQDYLEFQIKEIDSARLSDPNEEKVLEEEISILSGAEILAENGMKIYNDLFGRDDRSSAYDLISNAVETLEQMTGYDSSLHEKASLLKEILYSIQDISEFFRDYSESVEFNPDKLDMLQSRLTTIRNLKAKYRKSVSELIAFRQEIAATLENHCFSEERINEMERKKTNLKEKYLEAAKKLSSQRKKTGEFLSTRVENILRELEMKDAQFKVCLLPQDRFSETGMEEVEFSFSANKGEPLKPLAKVASGGELSRLMLSLKSILASVDTTPVLVFDEADTGIGGEAARKVGLRIGALAAEHQVICVTHSAQVAVFADNHIRISKKVSSARTVATVERITGREQTMEIARMIGGKELDTALRHAEKMLGDAKKEKKELEKTNTVKGASQPLLFPEN